MNSMGNDSQHNWKQAKFFLAWGSVVVLTALSTVSTKHGFSTALGVDEQSSMVFPWVLSLAVMVLQVVAFSRVMSAKSFRGRIGTAVTYAFLVLTSVSFGVGFWAERMDAKNLSKRGFDTNVARLEAHHASLNASLSTVKSALSDLAEYSAKMAIIEEEDGGTFAGSGSGPGERMRLRKSDDETLSMYQGIMATLADSVYSWDESLRRIADEFNPQEIEILEPRLVRLQNEVNAYAQNPSFGGLSDFLNKRIALGQEGMQYKGHLLDLRDASFEDRAVNVLNAIEDLPGNVELRRIFRPGGLESIRLVVNMTFETLKKALSFDLKSSAEVNADRSMQLRVIRSGSSVTEDAPYTVDRLAIILGWLIDILIAISVFVTPPWPRRFSYGEPHISHLAGVIRHMVDNGRAHILDHVRDDALLAAFMGENLSDEILSYVRGDQDGKYHFAIPSGDNSPIGTAVIRLAALVSCLPNGREVGIDRRFTELQRANEWLRVFFGRGQELGLDVITGFSKSTVIIIARLSDPEFWDKLEEKLEVEPSENQRPVVLKMEAEG